MPFSLRLDPDTEARIRRLAKASRRSKSAVVREAVAQYRADESAPSRGAPSALDRLRPFVGIVATGHQYSRDAHRKFRAALQRKRATRLEGVNAARRRRPD